MKRLAFIFCLLILIAPLFLFSEGLGSWKAAYGDWKMINGRLTQLSTKAGMAQAYMYVPQSGVMQYEFETRYLDGAQDGYAGFGIHIFIGKPHPRKSWGNDKSFLLWLTYDPKAYGGSGVYAQGYKSISPSAMNLMHPGAAYQIPADFVKQVNLNRLDQYYLPVKIVVDAATGTVKVYDPLRANFYYRLNLGGPLGKGLYVSLRTNSVAGSFGNIRVTRLK